MNASANDEIITFYDIPLVCGAAPAIGCGSRAKPLLMDLERQAAIREAWLSRAGTIVAIVWAGPARLPQGWGPLFLKHEGPKKGGRDDKTKFFPKKGGWVCGAQ